LTVDLEVVRTTKKVVVDPSGAWSLNVDDFRQFASHPAVFAAGSTSFHCMTPVRASSFVP
jgi:hypothetical protein